MFFTGDYTLIVLNDSLNVLGDSSYVCNTNSISLTAGKWELLASTSPLPKGKYLIIADISDKINIHYMRISKNNNIDAVIGNVPYGSSHINVVVDIEEWTTISMYVYPAESITMNAVEAKLQVMRIK